jgi:peptidoglycan biosynthesis protein MviN/MurJ (putative lipid II flippase)
VRETRGMASNAAITAVTQVASMGLGAAIAVVILLRFGKDVETDGLFAAYGVYGVLVVIAQSFRTTIVARLVEGRSLFAALDRHLGAVGVVFLAAAVPLVALAEPLARLLVGELGATAVHAARTALVILWFAAGAQLASALLAAALAVRDEFALPGAAYVVGGLVSIAALVGLAPLIGIQAVSLALCLGGATTASLMLARLVRVGYRPSITELVPDRRSLARAWLLIWAAVGAIAAQVTFVVTVGFAARLGEGSPTLYTYANFLFILFVAAIAGSMTIVLAPHMAETWDGRPESLRAPMLEVFRAGLVITAPLVGIVAVAGQAAAGLALDAHDAREVVDVFLVLSGGMVPALAMPVVLVALYASGRYGAVAAVGAASVALQFGLCAAALQLDSLVALAAASLVTGIVGAVLVLAVAFGRGLASVLAMLGRELAMVAGVGVLAFGPPAALGVLGGRVVQPIAALVGLGVFLALAPRALPRHWELAQRALAPLSARLRGGPAGAEARP